MAQKIIISESQLVNLIGKTNMIQEMNVAKMSCSRLTYESMTEFLGGREDKKLGHNTFVERISEFEIGIKYHNTYIVKLDPTDIMTVNTGGWDTVTTKGRLNLFLKCRNVYISQKNNKWSIHGTNDSLPYQDGMQVFPNGHVAEPVKR